MSSKIKVDTIETVAGSGNITLSNALVANSGVSIDNITIDGTEIDLSSGDLTLDVAGNIILDADGTDIILKDGGTTYGQFFKDGNDFKIVSSIQDGDIVFRGNDGGNGINAMTIDMSAGGKVGIGTNSPSHPLSVITSTDGSGLSGDDSFVAILQNAEATDDRSYGLKLMAGSTINDQALTVQDHDGSKDMFTIKGNGLHSMYLSSSDNNYVVNANPSSGGAGTKQWNLYYKSDSSVFTGYHYYAKKEPTILYADGDTIPSGKKVGDVKTQGETFEMGDVIVYENGKVTKCTKANATNVVGIYSGHPMPGGRWLSNDKDDIATEEHALEVASVGDSQDWNKTVTHYLTGFKVCNENGAIASGDLLCSASKTGYLMKQDGTAITSETVGKSMDTVSFDSDGNATGVYGFLYCG